MPQSIRCEECRTPLYEGAELKSPFEIIELYEGRCPKCGRKLSSVPKVSVKTVVNSTFSTPR